MLNKKQKAFINRAKLKETHHKNLSECCDSNFIFLLKDNYHEFSIDLTTILECLKFAEEQGAIPELPPEWWLLVKTQNLSSK